MTLELEQSNVIRAIESDNQVSLGGNTKVVENENLVNVTTEFNRVVVNSQDSQKVTVLEANNNVTVNTGSLFWWQGSGGGLEEKVITRNGDGYITQIETDTKTYVYTRINSYVSNIFDGTDNWSISRNANNYIEQIIKL